MQTVGPCQPVPHITSKFVSFVGVRKVLPQTVSKILQTV